MRREAFVRLLERHGCYLSRHGKKHDIFYNPVNGRKAPVPRHSEIKNSLCGLIQKQLGLDD